VTAIVPFSNGEFILDVEHHEADGFRVQAPGLARALDVTDARNLLRGVPAEEQGSSLVTTPGGEQRVSYVTEAGFYRVLGQRQTGRIHDPATRERVQRFQNWVYRDVLPSIRRTGGYGTPALPDLSTATGVLAMAEQLTATARQLVAAEAKVAELEPKAAAIDALTEIDGTLSMGAVANMFGIGRTTLFRILRKERIIQKDRRPYQQYATWFRVAMKTWNTDDGRAGVGYTSYLWPHGAARLHALLARRGHQLKPLPEHPALPAPRTAS